MKKIILSIILLHGVTTAYIVGLFERDFLNLPGHKVSQANSLYVDIGHRFLTPIETEGNFENVYQDLLGADGSGNIALSAAFGFGNLFDIKLARFSYTKLYSLSTRFNFMNQAVDKLPLSLSAELNYGLRTWDKSTHPDFKRPTFGGALILGRDFWKEKVFTTLVGAYQAGTDGENDVVNSNPHGHTISFGTNFGVRLDRWTVAFEYIRPYSGYFREVDGLILDNFGVGFRYRIYKHSFGITFNNHNINSGTDVIAGARNNQQSNYNMRFGFNITRQLWGY